LLGDDDRIFATLVQSGFGSVMTIELTAVMGPDEQITRVGMLVPGNSGLNRESTTTVSSS
jgi:hypothetical protein